MERRGGIVVSYILPICVCVRISYSLFIRDWYGADREVDAVVWLWRLWGSGKEKRERRVYSEGGDGYM